MNKRIFSRVFVGALITTFILADVVFISTNVLVAETNTMQVATPTANTGTFTSLTLGEAFDFAWSPRGDMLAVAAEAGIGIYDEDFIEVDRLVDNLHFTSKVVWSPDASQVAYTNADGHGIIRARVEDRIAALASLDEGDNLLLRLRVFSPDGSRVAGEVQTVGEPIITELGIWEAQSGTLVERRMPPLAANQVFAEVYDVYWDDEGLTLLIGVEGEQAGTYMWQANDTLIRLEAAQSGQVIVAGGGRFSGDGQLISARLADIDGVGIWQRNALNTPEQVLSPALSGAVNVLGEFQLLFGGSDGQLQMWETTPGRERSETLQLNTTRVLKGAWQPETDHFAALGQDGVIRLYASDTLNMVNALYAHARVDSLSWSPDGERITAWSNEPVDDVSVTFDAEDGAVVSGAEQALDPSQPFAPVGSAESITWAVDGSLAAWASPDHAGAIYERGNTEPLLRLDGSHRGFAWSPVAMTLAAFGDFSSAQIAIYTNISPTNVQDVFRLSPPDSGDNTVRALAWSPDGTEFAVAVGQTELQIFLYNLAQRQWSDVLFSRGVGAGTILLDWRANGWLYISISEASPLALDPLTGDVAFNGDVVSGTVYDDLDRYSVAQWNANETSFAGVAFEAETFLRIVDSDLTVIAEYPSLDVATGAGEIPLRWSPLLPDSLAFLDTNRLLRWLR